MDFRFSFIVLKPRLISPSSSVPKAGVSLVKSPLASSLHDKDRLCIGLIIFLEIVSKIINETASIAAVTTKKAIIKVLTLLCTLSRERPM